MDARLYVLESLLAHCRQLPPNDLGDITWSDMSLIRACAIRFAHGDGTAWRTFLDRLRGDKDLAYSAKSFFESVGILNYDVVADRCKIGQFPAGIELLSPIDEAEFLEIMDYWGPVWNTATDFIEPKRPSAGEITYLEEKLDLTGPARIGLVRFSQTRKTLYYKQQKFQSLGGTGSKANFFDVDTRVRYWISRPRRDGQDTLYSGIVHIDDDVRQEYWSQIRGLPDRAHETSFRSLGKYTKSGPR
jgi:hypothetical protein